MKSSLILDTPGIKDLVEFITVSSSYDPLVDISGGHAIFQFFSCFGLDFGAKSSTFAFDTDHL